MSGPVVRNPAFDFGAIPRDWYDNNATITHAADALHLLFPEGERFFIRSVMAFASEIDDPDLKARIRAFAGQEAMHGRAHEAVSQVVTGDYERITAFSERYKAFLTEFVEARFPPVMRLSITAALEHFTAYFAIVALQEGRMDAMAEPMRRLMRWHALEEIEHRDVAFDVLARVSGRYDIRVLGMLLAFGGLLTCWARAAWLLQSADPRMNASRRRADTAKFRARGWGYGFFGRALRVYLRPGFHPLDLDTTALEADVRVKLGLEGA